MGIPNSKDIAIQTIEEEERNTRGFSNSSSTDCSCECSSHHKWYPGATIAKIIRAIKFW